jgi:zinc protease
MRRCIGLALLLQGLVACSTAPKAQKDGSLVQPQGPATYKGFTRVATLEPQPGLAIHHYRHAKSGLEVLVSPKPGSGVVALVTAYEVGSRWEVNERTGLAHLFEHMMFRGTESYPKPFETLSDWGGRFNAYTSPDVTVYFELVPKKLFADAAKFEAERMRKLLITADGFDTERGAVVSERKMRTEDSPTGRLYWELFQLAYDRHPYKTGPIGWQEDLDATSFEDALAFYERFYAPNRAILSIVGDFSLKDALSVVARAYGDFESEAFEAPVVAAEPSRKGTRRKVIPMKVESVFLADAVFGPTYDDQHAAVDNLIANLLADGKLGYLAAQLVETGIARSVSGDADPGMDRGLSTVLVIGNPGVSRGRVEAAYDAARGRFPSWLTAQRLESFKLYYLAAQWASLRDPLHLAMQTANSAATTGDPAWDLMFLSKVQSVTLADVRARWPYWTTSARTRVILEPAKTSAPLAPKKGASR